MAPGQELRAPLKAWPMGDGPGPERRSARGGPGGPGRHLCWSQDWEPREWVQSPCSQSRSHRLLTPPLRRVHSLVISPWGSRTLTLFQQPRPLLPKLPARLGEGSPGTPSFTSGPLVTTRLDLGPQGLCSSEAGGQNKETGTRFNALHPRGRTPASGGQRDPRAGA